MKISFKEAAKILAIALDNWNRITYQKWIEDTYIYQTDHCHNEYDGALDVVSALSNLEGNFDLEHKE